MYAAASGEGEIENEGAWGLGLQKMHSFTFQPADIPQEVPHDFKELWPRNEFIHPTIDGNNCSNGEEIESSLEGDLKSKIASFMETLNLPRRKQSTTLHELLRGTMEDLQHTYPRCISCLQISEANYGSMHQGLFYFYKTLKSVGDLWDQNWSENFGVEKDVVLESCQQLGERVLERLNFINSRAKEMFDLMEKALVNAYVPEAQQRKPFLMRTPLTPTSVLPATLEQQSSIKEFSNITYATPLLRPLKLQAIGKLTPMDVKRFAFHMLPLMVDRNSRAVHEKDYIGGDLKADTKEMVMSVEPYSDAIIGNNGNGDAETKTYGASLLMSVPTSPRKLQHGNLLLQAPTAMPETQAQVDMEEMDQEMSKDNRSNSEVNKSSEATVLLASHLKPIMHLRVQGPQSETPTPPSTPTVWRGVYMPFFDPSMSMETIAYAMTVDDIGDYFMNDMDTDKSYNPSETSLIVTPPPPTPTPQLREAPQKPSTPPPPRGPMEQTEMPPLLPPPPQSSCAPMPPPPPPPPKGSSISPPAPSSLLPPLPPGSVSPPPPPPCSAPPPPPPPLRPGCGPLPPPLPSGSAPPPPLPPGAAGPAAPPPPPAMRALRAKNNTKLKRSSQMGNLYRLLKGKVEGSSLNSKAALQKRSNSGGKSGGNSGQGMADALAEITRRSSFFQQILEDAKNHSAAILELKSSISSFCTKDVAELQRFHEHVELHLEKLTDESQVLAKFEDFPTKKLETIRMAVALYSKLETVATTIKSWKVVSPVAQQLDKIETYFNKIKEEVDATDRNKDEESKQFKSHNIELDFSVLVRIKESMVDLSSNCIEVALKESKEAKAAVKQGSSKAGSHSKMLWRAFQLAFRVYNFAGGQDERADQLTRELAHEIETYS